MLLTKSIMVYGTPKNVSYYKKLGYDIKYHEYCEVSINDLSKYSTAKVDVVCDYCGDIFKKVWYKYCSGRDVIKKDCCKNCIHKKSVDVCNEKYGTNSTGGLDFVKEKRKNTFIEKYGVENPAQIEAAKEKIKATNLQRYGCENVFQNKDIQNKMHNTLEKKYQCDYDTAIKKIHEKIQETCMERYGVKYALQSKEVQKKAREGLKRTGTKHISCSKEQQRIAELYNCDINKQIDWCYVDLAFTNNIVGEYDGGGHSLCVLFGQKTQEQFDKEQKQREDFLMSSGYKIFRIINPKDKKMDDDFYLDLKQHIFTVFSNTKYNFYSYNIETKEEIYR